jgi:hypothetical protein
MRERARREWPEAGRPTDRVGRELDPIREVPLSKAFLVGKDAETGVLICADDFYSEHGIEISLNSEAHGLDPARKCASSAVGRTSHVLSPGR